VLWIIVQNWKSHP